MQFAVLYIYIYPRYMQHVLRAARAASKCAARSTCCVIVCCVQHVLRQKDSPKTWGIYIVCCVQHVLRQKDSPKTWGIYIYPRF